MNVIESKSPTEHLVKLDTDQIVTVYTAPGADPLSVARQASKPQPGPEYAWNGEDWVIDQEKAVAMAAAAQVKSDMLAVMQSAFAGYIAGLNGKYVSLNIDPAKDTEETALVKCLTCTAPDGTTGMSAADCSTLDWYRTKIAQLK